MKKLSFIFTLFLAVNSYAQESKFKALDGYGLFNEEGCTYTTEDGKENVALESTLCVSVYKADIKDLDEAYDTFRKENMFHQDYLPERVYVYSHLGLISNKDSIGEAKAEYESDKLKYYETRSVLIGENLKNTVSGVVIQKAYSLRDNIYYHIYEVNTSDIDEAYKIINEFRNEKYNTNYPLTLDKNKNTKRINSDYVTTDYDVMEVGIYTLELKKQGNKVVGIVEITGN